MLSLLFTLFFALGCWSFGPTGYAQVLEEWTSEISTPEVLNLTRSYLYGHDLVGQQGRNAGTSGSPVWTIRATVRKSKDGFARGRAVPTPQRSGDSLSPQAVIHSSVRFNCESVPVFLSGLLGAH